MALSDEQVSQMAIDMVTRCLSRFTDDLSIFTDDQVRKLEFLLWTECQERFVAIGDVEMLSDYRSIRGE